MVEKVKRNEKILVLKEREVLEVLETIENLVRHVRTLLNEIKYINVS
jgi:predicted transcriptional regulator